MKNRLYRIKIFYFLYIFLIMVIFFIILKFVVDFCKMSNEKILSNKKNVVEENRFVLNPRVQVENNGKFEYVESEKGFLNNTEYLFENIKMNGYFGDITSGQLEIKDNKNILEFTINPNFTIYLNNIEDK